MNSRIFFSLPAPCETSTHFDHVLTIENFRFDAEPGSSKPWEILTCSKIVPSEGLLFPSDLPYFIEELREQSVRFGEPIELTAQIGSKHEFGLKWSYPDKSRTDIIVTVRFEKFQTFLTFFQPPTDSGVVTFSVPNSTLEDAGKYQIILANDFGRVVSTCLVHVLLEPSPPQNFQFAVDPSKKHAIRLRWMPPENNGGSKLLWYTVEYTRPGESFTMDSVLFINL